MAEVSDFRYLVVPHTHWDREWYLPFEFFRLRLGSVVDGVLDTLERDPSFTSFTLDGQAIVLEDYVEVRPENAGRLQALLDAGRLEAGPSYVLAGRDPRGRRVARPQPPARPPRLPALRRRAERRRLPPRQLRPSGAAAADPGGIRHPHVPLLARHGRRGRRRRRRLPLACRPRGGRRLPDAPALRQLRAPRRGITTPRSACARSSSGSAELAVAPRGQDEIVLANGSDHLPIEPELPRDPRRARGAPSARSSGSAATTSTRPTPTDFRSTRASSSAAGCRTSCAASTRRGSTSSRRTSAPSGGCSRSRRRRRCARCARTCRIRPQTCGSRGATCSATTRTTRSAAARATRCTGTCSSATSSSTGRSTSSSARRSESAARSSTRCRSAGVASSTGRLVRARRLLRPPVGAASHSWRSGIDLEPIADLLVFEDEPDVGDLYTFCPGGKDHVGAAGRAVGRNGNSQVLEHELPGIRIADDDSGLVDLDRLELTSDRRERGRGPPASRPRPLRRQRRRGAGREPVRRRPPPARAAASARRLGRAAGADGAHARRRRARLARPAHEGPAGVRGLGRTGCG